MKSVERIRFRIAGPLKLVGRMHTFMPNLTRETILRNESQFKPWRFIYLEKVHLVNIIIHSLTKETNETADQWPTLSTGRTRPLIGL